MRIEEKNGDLVIVDFDEVEACRIACRIERDGVRFYTRLANGQVSPAMREVLGELASQESEHLDYFGGRLAKLREGREDGFEEDDLLGSIDYGIFQPYQDMEELQGILKKPAQALRLGIIVEDKSIRFYESCAAQVVSPGTRDELRRIAGEERRHKQLLEGLLVEQGH
ncbi:MAG: ferritin family protein [Candidatus Aureabacteria bacterium]|nr:ferritin family protein [Candidatus Auribacterota bacterium]